MAFSGNFMCTSFKKELLEGLHDFRTSSSDTFKLALYDNKLLSMLQLQLTLLVMRLVVQAILPGGLLYLNKTLLHHLLQLMLILVI